MLLLQVVDRSSQIWEYHFPRELQNAAKPATFCQILIEVREGREAGRERTSGMSGMSPFAFDSTNRCRRIHRMHKNTHTIHPKVDKMIDDASKIREPTWKSSKGKYSKWASQVCCHCQSWIPNPYRIQPGTPNSESKMVVQCKEANSWDKAQTLFKTWEDSAIDWREVLRPHLCVHRCSLSLNVCARVHLCICVCVRAFIDGEG